MSGEVTGDPEGMRETVRQAFNATVARVEAEVGSMPLERWNESVFRYVFCQAVAEAHPEIHQFVEADRIDLVLRTEQSSAFIEFKFYLRRRRIDAYTGEARGTKGGPSAQNLREFRSCVETLHARSSAPDLSKFIVLFYGDPTASGSARRARFSDYLDDYQHDDPAVPLQVVETHATETAFDDDLRATLFMLPGADRTR